MPTFRYRRKRPNSPEPMRNQHLRSASELAGYSVEATDGGIGHVEDLLVDDRDWSVASLIVDTRDWWPGKKVLLTPAQVRELSSEKSTAYLTITREEAKAAPQYEALETGTLRKVPILG